MSVFEDMEEALIEAMNRVAVIGDNNVDEDEAGVGVKDGWIWGGLGR
jgi:hypothetical protein